MTQFRKKSNELNQQILEFWDNLSNSLGFDFSVDSYNELKDPRKLENISKHKLETLKRLFNVKEVQELKRFSHNKGVLDSLFTLTDKILPKGVSIDEILEDNEF